MKLLIVYLILINAAGLLIMLIDKQKARRNRWRISEATLMTVAALGGSFGSLIGMKLFRHKTKRLKFSIGIPLLLVLHIIIVIMLYSTLK